MTTLTETSAVTEKTKELCQTILDDPAVGSIRQRIDAFMADEQARSQYETVMSKGQALNQKQQQSLPLSGEEITDFEKHRDAFINNPIAKGFMEAQKEMRKVQETVTEYVAKTFELGRVPADDDIQSGSCGSGCGCH